MQAIVEYGDLTIKAIIRHEPSTLEDVVLLIISILIYFLPSIVAFIRKKYNLLAIFLLNLFLGWSLVGWVIALVWAATHDAPSQAKKPLKAKKAPTLEAKKAPKAKKAAKKKKAKKSP